MSEINKTIHKWLLGDYGLHAIWMPRGAEILTVQMQHGKPCIWILCDASEPKERRSIGVFRTGEAISGDSPGKYVGTFQMYEGELVFHVFDQGTAELSSPDSAK